jgi:hypothetical protein
VSQKIAGKVYPLCNKPSQYKRMRRWSLQCIYCRLHLLIQGINFRRKV